MQGYSKVANKRLNQQSSPSNSIKSLSQVSNQNILRSGSTPLNALQSGNPQSNLAAMQPSGKQNDLNLFNATNAAMGISNPTLSSQDVYSL
jgi:hypothetical protein